jgi:dTDP-4-amino-4,6-dideoxygalactose transaminase
MQFLGFHYRLTEIQAALAISQLRRIKKFINKRKKIANFYNRKFANFTKIRTSIISRNPNSSHHLYIIHLRFGNLQKSKQQLIELFKKNGFTSQVHYKPIPLNPYYVNLGYKVDNIPNAMHYFNNALSIPIFPKLRIFQQRKIINSIKKEVDSAWIN